MRSLLITIILFLGNSYLVMAKPCLESENEFEHLIRDEILKKELKDLKASDLVEMYSTESLSQRMTILKNVLDTLRPFENVETTRITDLQRFAVARAKAMTQLSELGMTNKEARKAVDMLLDNPGIIKRITMLVTTLDVKIERENASPWLARSAVVTAFAFLMLPSISGIVAYMATGYWPWIPMASKFEAASVMYIALYGARGGRIMRNVAKRYREEGLVEGYFTRKDVVDGKKEWSEVNADLSTKFTDFFQRRYEKLAVHYKRYYRPWLGPYAEPAFRGIKAGASNTMNYFGTIPAKFRAYIFELILMMNVHRNANFTTTYIDSLKRKPSVYIDPPLAGGY